GRPREPDALALEPHRVVSRVLERHGNGAAFDLEAQLGARWRLGSSRLLREQAVAHDEAQVPLLEPLALVLAPGRRAQLLDARQALVLAHRLAVRLEAVRAGGLCRAGGRLASRGFPGRPLAVAVQVLVAVEVAGEVRACQRRGARGAVMDAGAFV